MATHAIVMARILVPDEDGDMSDYGLGPFIVQIRDRDNHKHLKGIKTGDMGPKFGFSSKDNGWMTMDYIRVPRDHLLAAFMSIDRDGSMSINGDPRTLFTTMLKTRVFLFSTGSLYLHIALLIATRYSVVRRQFKNISGQQEEV